MTNGEKYKTAGERAKAFGAWCEEKSKKDCTSNSPVTCRECQYAWLDLETKDEKPLPCPFCGSQTRVIKEWNTMYRVVCAKSDCWYSSTICAEENEVVESHNNVCRAVEKYNKEAKNENAD